MMNYSIHMHTCNTYEIGTLSCSQTAILMQHVTTCHSQDPRMRLHQLLQLEQLLELELQLKNLATLQGLADSIRAPKGLVTLGILIIIHVCGKISMHTLDFKYM